jgi:Putative phage tail protein
MAQLSSGVDYTLSAGGLYSIPAYANAFVTLGYTVSYPEQAISALGQLGLSLATGQIGQPVWPWLQSFDPARALAYSGMAYVYAQGYALTNQAEVENHSFEVNTGHSVSATVPDVWPAIIVKEFLTLGAQSVGWRDGRLASLTAFDNYCKARKIYISVDLAEQKPARDWMDGFAQICNSEWVWQGGKLDLIPRGDEAISSVYGSYTPSITPVFDLVHAEGGDILRPIEVESVVNEDAHNIIKIEWTNRLNAYAIEVMSASDQAHIEQFGQRPASVVAMHAIHDAAVAQSVAQQLLQREMTVWKKYTFTVPFSRALIGLMDLVTLTDADSALDRVPARITGRSESGGLEYTFTAEDAPIGSASAPQYGAQGGLGFSHNYNAAPGNVLPPVIFEAPVERSTTGLEVYAAVTGTAALWGGYRVWVSLDGLTYQDKGKYYGGARYGALSAPMATTGAAAVLLATPNSQMLTGTAQDAAALATLCWANGIEGGEYFSYETATLTAPGAYSLGGLVRGAYSNTVQAHAQGAQFVRIDDSVATSGPLDPALIGKTLHFKFTSFNAYGGGEQSLADVPEYLYTISGGQLKLPPPDVFDFAISLLADGVQASWAAPFGVPDYQYTQIKKGDLWLTALPAGPAGGPVERATTTWTWGWLPAGLNNLVAKHVDRHGAESRNAALASINIFAPAAPVANISVKQDFIELRWQDCTTSQPIELYEIKQGLVESSAQLLGTVSARFKMLFVQASGTYRYWVRAKDVAGNYGAWDYVDAVLSNPPGYSVIDKRNLTWDGTKTDAIKTVISTKTTLDMLVNTTRTLGQRAAAYPTGTDKINAGQIYLFQPSAATAQYEEIIDYLAPVSGTVATLAWQQDVIGTPNIIPTLSTKALIGDPWVDYVGQYTCLIAGKRYLKVKLNATSVGGDDLAMLRDGTVAVTTQVESKTVTLNITDTTTPAGQRFLFAAIMAPGWFDVINSGGYELTTPNSLTQQYFYTRDADPNPLGINIGINNQSGVRITGTVTLTVTGVKII